MNTKNNRRGQQTCERLKQSLLELLEHMDILDVTVSMLCDAAKINRSTFYSHYDSVADILEELELEIGKNLLGRFTADNYDENDPFSIEHLAIILEHMKENQNFYRALLSQSAMQRQLNGAFGVLFQQFILPLMRRFSVDDTASAYYFAFFQAGFLAVLRHWLQNRCRETPEEILSYLRNVLSHPEFVV